MKSQKKTFIILSQAWLQTLLVYVFFFLLNVNIKWIKYPQIAISVVLSLRTKLTCVHKSFAKILAVSNNNNQDCQLVFYIPVDWQFNDDWDFKYIE